MLRDICHRCRGGTATWLLVDEEHTYLVLYLDDRLRLKLRPRKQFEVMLLCETCKAHTVRFNRYRYRPPRKLIFTPWSRP